MTKRNRWRHVARPMVLENASLSPLAACRAHLIAGTALELRTLADLARKTGFQRIIEGPPGHTLSDPMAVTYYFFHYHLGESEVRAALSTIRKSAEPSQRFAPAIMIIGKASASDVLRLVGQGFDDIVALPEKAPILEKRFALHINTPITYFETESYLGPDRRRLQHLMGAREPELRGGGSYRHRRYTLRRIPRTGIQILSRQVITTVTPLPPPGVTIQPQAFE